MPTGDRFHKVEYGNSCDCLDCNHTDDVECDDEACVCCCGGFDEDVR